MTEKNTAGKPNNLNQPKRAPITSFKGKKPTTENDDGPSAEIKSGRLDSNQRPLGPENSPPPRRKAQKTPSRSESTRSGTRLQVVASGSPKTRAAAQFPRGSAEDS